MSRCFPFPPPGYEKKARLDDSGLLEKEKQKEKRHKKEKKDKEKKEGKEKKENGKNKEKHKDKKDRREKHKEKEKEKNGSSDAKKSEPRTGSHDGEKLEFNGFKTGDLKDSKHVRELAKRIRDENGASGSQMVASVAAPDDRRVELARKLRGSDGASGSQTVEKIASDERKVKLAETIVNRNPEKEKVKNKREDHQKANGQGNNGQGNHVGARGAEKPSGQIPSRLDQERGEPITKPLPKENFVMHVEGKQKGEAVTKPLPKENVDNKHVEGKEKSKHKEREGKGDKHKHKDRDKGKDKKSKDKDGDKEKKTEEKAKENKEHIKSKGSDPKLKENAKELLDFRNTKLPDPPKLSNPGLPSDGTLGKRKEPEKNGYLLDEENWSNKSAKHLYLHQPVNGTERKPESIQTATELGVQGATNNHVVGGKDIKINGFILPEQRKEIPAKPAATHSTRNENGEASVKVKPPHPDTKYLSQILCVPMVEDLPNSLDQEWLLGSEPRALKKHKQDSPAVDGTLQVWSGAVRIESADISALPYVIPY